jgi:hypothetical protein
MNVRTLVGPIVIVLLLTAAMPAFAAELVFNCSDMRMPDQRLVSHVFGIANFGQAYAARARAMQIAQRACLRGASEALLAASDVSYSVTRKNAKSTE